MATDFFIKRRDQLPEIVAILKDALGTIINLTGSTVKFIMINKSDSSTTVMAPANIVGDPTTGTVSYSWVAPDTDTGGTFSAEFEVTFADGRAETFPNSTNLTIKITDDLGGVSL